MRFEKELQVARSIAMHAGELAVGYQAKGVQTETKNDLSPVTIADRECEKLIAARLTEAFPEDGLLGEEGSNKQTGNGRRWIIDPIDGTRDFVRGFSTWSVLLALEVDGEMEVGVCNMAVRKEMYSAVRGEGTYCNERRLRASAITAPCDSLLFFNGLQKLASLEIASRTVEWMSQFWAVRSLSGCADAMALAGGQGEVWIEPQAAPWDLAPLKVILEESGITFMNFNGKKSIYGGDCVAFVPALEPQVKQLLGLG